MSLTDVACDPSWEMKQCPAVYPNRIITKSEQIRESLEEINLIKLHLQRTINNRKVQLHLQGKTIEI